MRYYYTKDDVHYVVFKRTAKGDYQEHVFDYKNLMLYLLDATVDLSDKVVYYYEEIYRKYRNNRFFAEKNSARYMMDMSKLLRQAYEYEAKVLNKKVAGRDGILVFPDRKWTDCFRKLEVKDMIYTYTPGSKFRGYSYYRIPPKLWRKVKFCHIFNISVYDYDEEDYSRYLTHKERHKPVDYLGPSDDHFKARRSRGWKESTKRKHQYKD